MNIQLTISIGSKKHTAFLRDNFDAPYTQSKYLHNHKYPEMHLITGGNALFHIGNHMYEAKSGTILIVPPDVFHCYLSKDETAQRAAFQIDCEINTFSVYHISPDTILDFFNEIKKCKISQDYTKLSAYITLFCSYIYPKKEFSAQPLTDYGFLIQEFLSRNYGKDLHLRDLANALHLSERQVERLVIEHTKKPFKEALTEIRMNIAKQLLTSTEMPKNKIAEYVGYKSYAGFFKAMKKYGL